MYYSLLFFKVSLKLWAHSKFSRHIFPSPLQSPLRAAERGEMVRKFEIRPKPVIYALLVILLLK
ncbi:MAG: hypothetical protein BGP14_12335 [Sphingobacteriales bacterium 44-15]|nr:MAG: hypothetical protein BGP14_12335 [Sphingobacteriales bacterium 44-15]